MKGTSWLKNIGRKLADSEIGCAASHLKAYNYVIKNKIEQAIIMEDDSFPSEFLYQWLKNNIKIENRIPSICLWFSYLNFISVSYFVLRASNLFK